VEETARIDKLKKPIKYSEISLFMRQNQNKLTSQFTTSVSVSAILTWVCIGCSWRQNKWRLGAKKNGWNIQATGM